MDSFSDSELASLPLKSPGELAAIEQRLSSEFTNLSREYLVARQQRINEMLASLTHYVKVFSDNEKNWLKVYSFEKEAIESIRTNVEDLVLDQQGLGEKHVLHTLQEYETELAEVLRNVQLPLDITDPVSGMDLPYKEQFVKIVQPYHTHLEAASNENAYQTNMLQAHVHGQRKILWNQYLRAVLDYKNDLIAQTEHQLQKLHSEYHGRVPSQLHRIDSAIYNRGVVPISALREHDRNTDGFYGVDNRWYQNNRVELTNIRRSVLANISAKALDSCHGLLESEIDSDLALMRSSFSDLQKSEQHRKEQRDEAHRLEKEILLQHEREAELHQQELELSLKSDTELTPDQLMARRYKQLLLLEARQHVFMPELPPIEYFPQLA